MRPDLDVGPALAFLTQAPTAVPPIQTQTTTPTVQPIPEATSSSTQPTLTGETAEATEKTAAAVGTEATEEKAPEVVVEVEEKAPEERKPVGTEDKSEKENGTEPMTGIVFEKAQEVETTGVQAMEEEVGVREEEFQKKTHEEHVPLKVVDTPAKVGVDEAEAGERENVGLKQMDEGGFAKKVSEEKETVEDGAVGIEVDQEVVEKEAESEAAKVVIEVDDDSEEEPPRRVFKQKVEGEEDQSTLVSERMMRPRECTPPMREATPPREDTPPMTEQSPQLEEKQMGEPNNELEAERLRQRQERKRRGKLLAQLARKKVKTASPTVTI